MDASTAPHDAAATLRALADEAVTYTYPLYEMARMRAATSPRQCAAGPAGDGPDSPQRWCNLFTHARKLLGAGESRVVTPNHDTLYTNAWLDLRDGPLVIDVPDTGGRYYVLGLLDFYTHPFASIGQRSTGTAARAFVITQPGWQGRLPAALQAQGAQIVAPTPWVWIIGRILVDGTQDLPAVHALQDGFRLRTLADWCAGAEASGTPRRFDPGFDARAAADGAPDAARFAAVVNQALRDNPPPAHEQALLARFAAVGLGAQAGAPRPGQQAALDQALAGCLARWRGAPLGRVGPTGWQSLPLLGHSFGDDHERRALVALKYIGALDSREAFYPMAHTDNQGRPLHGRRAYRLRFAPGGLPPVQAFWSLTMYDATDCMLVPNAIARYAIGDRTPGLRPDADGGLTLHIGHEAPSDPAAHANWLPAPAGGFYLCLRAYVPSEEMLDGRYTLPPLERLADPADQAH